MMAAGNKAQLPATVAASRSVEKALEEAAASGALHLSNRKLKEFPRSARNYDLSDISHAGRCGFHAFFPNLQSSRSELAVNSRSSFCLIATCFFFFFPSLPTATSLPNHNTLYETFSIALQFVLVFTTRNSCITLALILSKVFSTWCCQVIPATF